MQVRMHLGIRGDSHKVVRRAYWFEYAFAESLDS